MNIICKKWVELRELPGLENSEISYIKLQDIERVSFIENSSNEGESFIVIVSALGDKYLCAVEDTLQDAQRKSKSLIQDIENSKENS